jgi:signal transduction histidine kinase
MCCDPAFGFADQSTRWAKEIAQPTYNAVPERRIAAMAVAKTMSLRRSAAEMAVGDRDNFLDGCLKVQEDERLRLGRELHDSTGNCCWRYGLVLLT